ncbi:MAG: amino acid synthesis family protein [Firmicutes bacterium]|nr:amino acid synthesis family protein [Bacillota bacterium]
MAYEPKIRKIVTTIEEVLFEGFDQMVKPITTVSVAAVIKNSFAGRYQENLEELSEVGEWLGDYLSKIAAAHLDGTIETYGKGAIIGLDGELEHGAAILHPKLGKPMRDVIGGGKSIIPSAKKSGPAGTALDVPLHFIDAAFVRTHYGAMEVRLHDAPKADEIVVALVFSNGGRPHPRIGGLTITEAKCQDGLR